MASESNGGAPGAEPLTLAQRLMEKHGLHQPTVEDAPDEEDTAHPPPSAASQISRPDSAVDAAVSEAPALPSDKALGKQKAQPGKPAGLDTSSEEAFPALGAPKTRGPATVAPAWGRKPASSGLNGANGLSASSNVSSRASTPASGMATPASNARYPAQAMSLPLSLPGKHVERITFAPHQLMPRNLLRKPLKDIIHDINARSKAKITFSQGANGMMIFEGQGPVDSVRLALKELASTIGSKQSVKVAIPASVRAHVIGRQGATIQGISKRTGARIQIPKQEDTFSPAEDDDSATIDVVIEGDAVAAEMARQLIEAIVNERTSRVNIKLKDIPAEYYPFIAGPHNTNLGSLEDGRDVRVQIPTYHQWTEQAPTEPARGQPVPFTPQSSYPIQISGDRKAVQEVRDSIERQAQDLRRQLTLGRLLVERGRQQFVVGERGGSIHDFLEETGCSVILPPSSDDSEVVYVVGPADKLDNGLEKVMDLATSMAMTQVDIARLHANSQAHARNLTRYLQQKRVIQELERLHEASIVVPTNFDGPTAWEVYARDGKKAMRARTDIMNLVQGHPPSRVTNMAVDPFYYHYLQQRSMQQVRQKYGVQLVFPEEVEAASQLLLVYEGACPPAEYELPRRAPATNDIREFQRALQEAQQHISSLVSGRQEIVSRDLEAPVNRFHDKLRRYVDREQAKLPEDEIPVQLIFGQPSQQKAARKLSSNGFALRGPSNSVDELTAKILAFIEQEERDELERGYTISFDYPQKFANRLIGRGGEHIKELRDKYDVDIQVHDGKVEVKGPKAKADAAKVEILALAKKLEDETTHTLKIQPQYHRDLIGAKGSQVNRLQERYNVRINFPRSAISPSEEIDADMHGSQRGHRSQALDEVVIRGPRRGADEARDELLNLVQWTIDHSHTATVSVAQSQLPSLIGQGGREMENLRLATGAQIDVPNARDAADAAGRVEVKIKGTKQQVQDAKKVIEERARIFDQTVIKTINIDKRHHKAIIGGGGASIRSIVVEAGGPDDRRALARFIRFPAQDSDDTTIRLEGNKSVVEKVISTIQAFVAERESQVTESIEVAPERHRILIGRGGETRRHLESQLSVSIDIPKQNTTGAARSQVKITGKPVDVEKAKEHILALVKEQEGETVQIPRRYHHTIADNGQFFRRLHNEYRVKVDHAGQQPPARPSPAQRSLARVNGSGTALPLITDQGSPSADAHSWEIVDDSENLLAEEGTIPWVLRGTPENVAKARVTLEKALEAAHKPSATGYLILPDPKAYRLVVGPGGSQINSIRRKTGTRVNVPRDQAKGEAIEIHGSREGVEEAKDIILGLVQNFGQGRRA